MTEPTGVIYDACPFCGSKADKGMAILHLSNCDGMKLSILSRLQAQGLLDRIAAALRLAKCVQTVIHAQTNFTIDVVGIDKMRAQRKALEDFQNAKQPQPGGGNDGT